MFGRATIRWALAHILVVKCSSVLMFLNVDMLQHLLVEILLQFAAK